MEVGVIQTDVQSDPRVCNLRGLGQSQKLVISTVGRNLLLLLPDEKQISPFGRNDKFLGLAKTAQLAHTWVTLLFNLNRAHQHWKFCLLWLFTA